MLPSMVEDLFKQVPWSQRHSCTVHLEVNWKQNISHWFCLLGCCLLSVRPRGCKQNESNSCWPWASSSHVKWTSDSFMFGHSRGDKRATVFCGCTESPRAMLENAFFLFLDLNRSMPLNVFLWIQITLCCWCSWEGEAATCLEAAAGHL